MIVAGGLEFLTITNIQRGAPECPGSALVERLSPTSTLGVCADAGGMLCHPKDVEVIGQIPVQRQQLARLEHWHRARILKSVNLGVTIGERVTGGVAMITGRIIDDLPQGIRIRGVPAVVDTILAFIQKHKQVSRYLDVGSLLADSNQLCKTATE